MKSQISHWKELYETEYDQWLTETVKLLKTRQLEALDYNHFIEELEALGRSEKNAVKSLLLRKVGGVGFRPAKLFKTQIIIHLLFYQFWELEQERSANHWAGEIITFRVQIEDRLTTNLRKYLASELPKIYQNALLIVRKKTQLNSLPEQCPYSFEQLLETDWFPY